jgi:hypothetical protein
MERLSGMNLIEKVLLANQNSPLSGWGEDCFGNLGA